MDQTHDILGKEGEHVNSTASACGLEEEKW